MTSVPALARLSHPHIVQVYDFGESPMPYLIMEYVDGVNLRQAMDGGGLSAREALAIVPKLCEALHYAHEHYQSLQANEPPGRVFPDTRRPDYFDFLYVAAVIGTSAQTADVAFGNSEMRRVGLVHCVLAFFFNATLLALMVNVGAALL